MVCLEKHYKRNSGPKHLPTQPCICMMIYTIFSETNNNMLSSLVLKLIFLIGILAVLECRVLESKGTQILKAKQELTPTDDEYDESEIVENDEEENFSDTTETIINNIPETDSNDVVQENNVVTQQVISVPPVNADDASPINRYCKCSTYECNCCRDFSLPLMPIKGPGCATIQYLESDKMSVGIKFGDRVLANRIISGRKATPVCLPLPGGYSRFCGRIYGITKRADDFKACLGLELRADNEVEAVLRVSCFKFGPRGLAVTDSEPLPPIEDNDGDDDDGDEDDDEDDIFGFSLGGAEDDDDDDDDDEDDDDEDDDVEDDDDNEEESEATGSNDVIDNETNVADSPDYTGFSLLEGDFFDDLLGLGTKKKKKNNDNLTKKNSVKQNIDISNNTTVNKEESSIELSDIVQTLATSEEEEEEDDDDDADDDNDTESSSKEKDKDTAQLDSSDENDEDETDEDVDVEENELETKTSDIKKKKPFGFSFSNFKRLFRFLS